MIAQLIALVGAALVAIAGIGVIRFDDSLSRLHALTKASTLGVMLVFIGAAVGLDRPNDWTSLLLAALIQLVTSPIAASLIARSTYLDAVDAAVDAGDTGSGDTGSGDTSSGDTGSGDTGSGGATAHGGAAGPD